MQRRRLLSAIVEVVAEHGLEGASVGRICKRAGVSRRTFYDLFDDRENCFLAACELTLERLADRVAPVYAGKGRWRERVRGALTVLLECFEDRGIAQLCLVDTLKAGPEVLARRCAVLAALTVAIDEGRAVAKGAAAPPPLTAESIVGGAVAVVHSRLVVGDPSPLIELVNPLMSMIALPYLGPAAARKELERPIPVPSSRKDHATQSDGNPFTELPIRITFRTARVLSTVGSRPDASNREIGMAAGVGDQGQMSKLLRRLEKAELIENHGQGQAKGESNAWRLTARGQGVMRTVWSDDSP